MVPTSRIRPVNGLPTRPDGAYVLYWMTAFRRTRANFALERAVDASREWRKPLIVLEALRCDYRWASDRLHRFVVDGMADNARAFAGTPVAYLPYVEPARGAGKGLLESLARDACLVVTDDFPCFFLPRMIEAAGQKIGARLEAVDSNGILSIRATPRTFMTAFSFRAHLQRTFREHLRPWPKEIEVRDLPALQAPLPRGISSRWPATSMAQLEAPAALLASLPIDHSIAPTLTGGARAADVALARFVADALDRYPEDHNQPETRGTSGLSPYLHFGHIAAHDVFAAVMTHATWTTRKLGATTGGKRQGWWGAGEPAEAFLDQLVTWREIGFNMCATRPDDYGEFSSLPDWAQKTLGRHAGDRRQFLYSRDALMAARTHDPVWNAAQRQLTRDGWMHNYLRMLWGKKILEWSPSPEDALAHMTEIMNAHAIDGRDPNSYSGYLWTLGRYDRPWSPEREIYGTVRYMSSANTVKKLRMKQFLATYGEDT